MRDSFEDKLHGTFLTLSSIADGRPRFPTNLLTAIVPPSHASVTQRQKVATQHPFTLTAVIASPLTSLFPSTILIQNCHERHRFHPRIKPPIRVHLAHATAVKSRSASRTPQLPKSKIQHKRTLGIHILAMTDDSSRNWFWQRHLP
jgi:hypothetical protein